MDILEEDRSNEVKYLIDGVPVNDVYSGQSSLIAGDKQY